MAYEDYVNQWMAESNHNDMIRQMQLSQYGAMRAMQQANVLLPYPPEKKPESINTKLLLLEEESE